MCSSGTSTCPLSLCYLPFSYLYCPQPPPRPRQSCFIFCDIVPSQETPPPMGTIPPSICHIASFLECLCCSSGLVHCFWDITYSFSLVYSVIFAGAQSQAISLKKDALEVNFLRWFFFLIDQVWPSIQTLMENHPQNFEDMKIFHLLLLGKIWWHFGTRPFPGNTYLSSPKILMASVSAVLTFHVNMSAGGFSRVHFLEHSADLFWRLVSFHCGHISCIISLLILRLAPPPPPPLN